MQSVMERFENALEKIFKRVQGGFAVLLPLLVAAGFATASASAFVNARYGPEEGNLIVALGFAVISLAAYVVARWITARPSSPPEPIEHAKLLRQTPLAGLMDATSSGVSRNGACQSSHRRGAGRGKAGSSTRAKKLAPDPWRVDRTIHRFETGEIHQKRG